MHKHTLFDKSRRRERSARVDTIGYFKICTVLYAKPKRISSVEFIDGTHHQHYFIFYLFIDPIVEQHLAWLWKQHSSFTFSLLFRQFTFVSPFFDFFALQMAISSFFYVCVLLRWIQFLLAIFGLQNTQFFSGKMLKINRSW